MAGLRRVRGWTAGGPARDPAAIKTRSRPQPYPVVMPGLAAFAKASARQRRKSLGEALA